MTSVGTGLETQPSKPPLKRLLKRPLLIGGVGLSMCLWLFDGLQQSLLDVGGIAALAVVATGTGIWWWRRQAPVTAPLQPATLRLDRTMVEGAIARAAQALECLGAELDASQTPQITAFRSRLNALTEGCDRQGIRIAVLGGKGSGKSTLVSLLASPQQFQSPQRLILQEIPVTRMQQPSPHSNPIKDRSVLGILDGSELSGGAFDLVLFLVTGDLTEPEHHLLQQLVTARYPLLLVLNKCDQYLPRDRPLIISRLQQYMIELGTVQPERGLPALATYPLPRPQVEDVLAIAAHPSPLKVRRHQPNGTVDEWVETPVPDIASLTQRLAQHLTQDAKQLVWGTVVRSAVGLHQDIQTVLNQVRHDRAMPLLEQYQWIAAAAAFANPVPALDLLATGAITAQLVLDLSSIYRQPFSLSQAQAVATTLASLLVKLGLVELSTQLLSGLLKSNAATFMVGGLVQGASAAYLTRLAGLSLVDYFQDQSLVVNLQTEQPLAIAALSQRLQTIFQQNRQQAILQTFLQTVARNLSLNEHANFSRSCSH